MDSVDANANDPMYPFPKDGYRVEHHVSAPNDTITLVMFLTMQGKPKWSWTLKTWNKNTPVNRGKCMRLYWLFMGVAHFLNSGGRAEELNRQIFGFIRGNDENRAEHGFCIPPPDLGLPDGLELLTTELWEQGDDDGEFTRREYVFGNLKTGEALVWLEDVDVRKTTLGELNFEMAEMEEVLNGEAAEVQPPGSVQAQEEDTGGP